MKKPTNTEIQTILKALRNIAEGDDLLEARIAWEVEHAIRWVTEETEDWTNPAFSVAETAELIRSEMEQS